MLTIAAGAVIAAILILLLSGGGARRSGAASAGTVLQIASGYLHLSTSEVRRRLRAGETLGEIAQSTRGASRVGLIDAVYARRAQAIERLHLPPATEHAELKALRRALAAQVDRARRRAGARRAAARYLGLSEAKLSAKLTGGRTLAQLAASIPGRSRAGLIEALIAPRRRALARALKDNRITAAAAHAEEAKLAARAERLIARPGG
jgi:DNA-binding transcriptional regulator YdaS (Cro superfamily)